MPRRSALSSRRQALQGLLALGGLGTLGVRSARAWAQAPLERRFVFVTAFGGWDPTRVFAPEFHNPFVSMEADAEAASEGGLTWVSHPDRPNVDAYFASHARQSVFLNGVIVPSASHVTCAKLLFTSSSVAGAPDWPARIGAAEADRFSLPQVVLAGPHYPHTLGGVVSRVSTGGAIERLLRGDLLALSDVPVGAPDARLRSLMDRHTEERAVLHGSRAETDAAAVVSASFVDAHDRASTLKSLVDELRFGEDGSLESQVDMAVDLLALDISRVVNLALADLTWDSHEDNDPKQSVMFEDLFRGLNHLQAQLADRRGTDGRPLSESTVVVVLSEMGRTPHLNAGAGKDHWSHTSVLLTGGGLEGGQVVGAYSDLYMGQPVDPGTGRVSEAGVALDTDVLGATLLGLGGVPLDDDLLDATPLACIVG